MSVSNSSFSRARQRIERVAISLRPLTLSGRLWLVRAADIVLIVAGCVAMSVIFERLFGVVTRQLNFTYIGLAVAIIFVLLNDFLKLYRHSQLNALRHQLRGVLLNWVLAWAFLTFMAFALKSGHAVSRGTVFMLIAGGIPALALNRYVVQQWLAREGSLKRIARERIGLLSVGARATLDERMERLTSAVVTRSIPNANHDQTELVEAFVRECQSERVDRILICAEPGELARIDMIRDAFRKVPVQVLVMVDPWLSDIFRRPLQFANGLTAFEFNLPPLSMPERIVKRSLDIVLSLAGLVLLTPLMALIALAVRLDSPGPVIFRQRRLGFNGREFSILKFRSMCVLENGPEILQATPGDPRVTKIGRFLRANSLDELPQLWNVLCGDMSLVGPRPHALAHDRYYDTRIADYSLRRHMRPGLTGWAQVNGRRGETKDIGAMEDRVKFDLYYINNWSVWLDLWIMAKTALELVRNRAVY